MQPQMVDIFRNHHVREESFAGERFFDCLWRRGRFHDALVTVRTRVFWADGFDDDKTVRFVFELFGDVLPDARPRVAARTLLVGISDVDLDTTARQVRRQWPPSGGPAPRMAADRGLARVHLHRFGYRAALVGELLERELQLPRIHTFGFLAKQPLTQNVELMPQRGDLALRFRQLLVKRGDEGARGGQILDGVVERAQLIHSLTIYDLRARVAYAAPADRHRATRSYQRRRRVVARSTPDSNSRRSRCRISTDAPVSSRGHANVPPSRRLYKTQKPEWSHSKIFRRSPRRLRKMNRWPESGSSCS